MENQKKQNDGPTCACGKADLYEEWLKQQENHKEEVSGSTSPNQAKDENSYAVDVGEDAQ